MEIWTFLIPPVVLQKQQPGDLVRTIYSGTASSVVTACPMAVMAVMYLVEREVELSPLTHMGTHLAIFFT